MLSLCFAAIVHAVFVRPVTFDYQRGLGVQPVHSQHSLDLCEPATRLLSEAVTNRSLLEL